MTNVSKYLKDNETLWEIYTYNQIPDFIVITIGYYREEYILYQLTNGKRKEVKRSDNPMDFHKIIEKRRSKMYDL